MKAISLNCVKNGRNGSVERIQSQTCPDVEYEPGPLSSVPGFCGRVQAIRLGRGVGQILLVPVPAWLCVVQICGKTSKSGVRVLLAVLHLEGIEGWCQTGLSVRRWTAIICTAKDLTYHLVSYLSSNMLKRQMYIEKILSIIDSISTTVLTLSNENPKTWTELNCFL